MLTYRGFAVLWTVLAGVAAVSLGAARGAAAAGPAIAATPVPAPTPTPTPTPRPDVRIRVVFFPATIVPPPPDASGGVGTLPYTGQQLNAAIMPGLVQSVQQRRLYDACLFDGSPSCDPGSASVIVRTTFRTDSAGSTTTQASPTFDVTLNAIDMVNRRALDSLPLTKVAISQNDVLAPSGVRKTGLQLLNITPDQLTPLLGAPAIVDGSLVLVPGYQPYIQLVPTLANANDPTYFAVFQNLLARRGLPTEASQFNAGAVTSASTPLDAICGLGQRYLVYSLNIDQIPMSQNFSTRLEAHASGRLYDCTDFTVTGVGIDKNTHVITSKASLASIVAILTAAFTKTPGFAKSITAATLTADFIDTKPDSQTVRDQLSESALRQLVDRLCFALDRRAAEATPEPSPPALALPVTTAAESPAVTAQAQREVKKTNDVAYAAQKTTQAAANSAAPAMFAPVEQSASRHAVTKQQLTTLANSAKTVKKLATATANTAQGTATAAQAANAKAVADSVYANAKMLAARPQPSSIKPEEIGALQAAFTASADVTKGVQKSAKDAKGAKIVKLAAPPPVAPPAGKSQNGAGTPSGSTGAAASAGAGGLASLDVGSFVAPKPVPLTCRAHELDKASPTEPPRWHPSRWSSASPNPSTTP